MSTIQNLKNFIRHGKQARGSNPPHAEATTNLSPVHAHPERRNYALSDPDVAVDHRTAQGVPAAAYSLAGGDKNQAAQAGGAAARAAGDEQRLAGAVGGGHTVGKNYDPEVLERIVAEERESKGKLPKYPGLDRYILVEKMGDGAFSNVYRAKDTQSGMTEVAIKVVRKFEMNQSQVSHDKVHRASFSFALINFKDGLADCISKHVGALPTKELCLGRQTSTPRFEEATQNGGGARTFPISPT